MYNLEATPAEGTTYRFAKEDRKRWPDILQAGTAEMPYYTNSSQLPVGFTDDPFEALTRQEELQTKYTGGHGAAPLHERAHLLARSVQGAGAPLARALPAALHHDHADVLDLPAARLSRGRARVLPEMRRGEAGREAAQARRLTQSRRRIAMNTMTEAKHLDATITLTDDERQRCEVWTRVMGYHRPVASFNIGKKGEHCERRFFREERARPHAVGAARREGIAMPRSCRGRRLAARRRAARRRLRAVHVHRLSGRARGGRLLPGLPVALRLLPQSAPHSRARRRRARFRAHPLAGWRRAAACSTRSSSRAASRPRRPSFRPRSTRCARSAS